MLLSDGSKCRFYNIAWGYELGDDYAHITANISPEQEGADIDFFYSQDIVEVVDEESGRIVFRAE